MLSFTRHHMYCLIFHLDQDLPTDAQTDSSLHKCMKNISISTKVLLHGRKETSSLSCPTCPISITGIYLPFVSYLPNILHDYLIFSYNYLPTLIYYSLPYLICHQEQAQLVQCLETQGNVAVYTKINFCKTTFLN